MAGPIGQTLRIRSTYTYSQLYRVISTFQSRALDIGKSALKAEINTTYPGKFVGVSVLKANFSCLTNSTGSCQIKTSGKSEGNTYQFVSFQFVIFSVRFLHSWLSDTISVRVCWWDWWRVRPAPRIFCNAHFFLLSLGTSTSKTRSTYVLLNFVSIIFYLDFNVSHFLQYKSSLFTISNSLILHLINLASAITKVELVDSASF